MEPTLTDFLIPEPAFFGPIFTILVLALLLDAVFGDFPWLFSRIGHTVVWIGNLIGWFEKRLNRPNYSNADRLLRGAVTSLAVIFVSAMVGGLVQVISDFGGILIGIEVLLVAILVAQKGLYQHVKAVSKGWHCGWAPSCFDDCRAQSRYA